MQRVRRGAALCAAVVSVAAAGGCAGGRHASGTWPGRPAVLTSSQVAALRSFGAGDTSFGLNVLSALCRRRPGTNVLISPVSLVTGLSMAYLGARGGTAAAMARVLHLPATGPRLVAGLRARRALLASLNRPGVAFAESSRLWADPSLVTIRSYAAALRESYRAGVTRVPLLSAPDQARARINTAIAAQIEFDRVCHPLYGSKPGYVDELRQRLARSIQTIDVDLHYFRHEAPRFDPWSVLGTISCPVLPGGRRRPDLPTTSVEDLARQLPAYTTRLTRLSRARHDIFREQPDLTFPAIEDFVRRIKSCRR